MLWAEPPWPGLLPRTAFRWGKSFEDTPTSLSKVLVKVLNWGREKTGKRGLGWVLAEEVTHKIGQSSRTANAASLL